MKRHLLALFCAAVILCVTPPNANARVGLVHERSFTLSGVDSVMETILRASHNGDSLLALVSDGKHIVLYSVTQDSTLYHATLDSLSSILAIEYGDVNRDSVPDIAALRVSSDLPGVGSSNRYWVDVYNQALAFEKDSMQLDTFPLGATGFCSGPSDGPFLRALDLNDDGYNELVVSRESPGGDDYGYGLWLGWTAGETYVFYSAPDSLTQDWPIHLIDAFDLGTIAGHHSIAAYNWYIACGEGVGTDHLDVTRELRLLTDSGVTTKLVPLGTSYERCWEFDANFGCVGNFGPGSFGQALLASTRSSVQTDCYFNPTAPIVSSALELRALISPDSTSLLWSRDITGTNYSNFAYDPLLPGYFFGFSGDTLLMFRGSDGSIRDQIADVPSGRRYWDLPYNDSIPRLIVINGTTVSIYHLDITTGITEPDHHPTIPSSFALGDPYPNPFNPEAMIPVATGPGGTLTLSVYNITGQRVATLYESKVSPSQRIEIRWNTKGMASGVYFLRASLNGMTATKKMMLLK